MFQRLEGEGVESNPGERRISMLMDHHSHKLQQKRRIGQTTLRGLRDQEDGNNRRKEHTMRLQHMSYVGTHQHWALHDRVPDSLASVSPIKPLQDLATNPSRPFGWFCT